jgi:hypothetical protein
MVFLERRSLNMNFLKKLFTFEVNLKFLNDIFYLFKKYPLLIIVYILIIISISAYVIYYFNGVGLSYNDARSHLNIGRRVVEGLKPGIAQLGSVWLPLPHALIALTVWNDFMWHSGLAGALFSMISYVATSVIIYFFLKQLGAGMVGRVLGIAVFALNTNILYLQSTAMTELLLIGTMTAAVFELMMWFKSDKLLYLIRCAFWIMLSTLARYDGWFLLAFVSALIVGRVFWKKGFKQSLDQFKNSYQSTEGIYILFGTLAGFGVFLWLLWNLIIFKDPLYFAFGPYSAHAQQQQIESAGELLTKGNLWLSIKFYLYALFYNSNAFLAILSVFGVIALWLDKKVYTPVKVASMALFAPLLFNIFALYAGHSVLFIQGLSGNTWFNVRYGVMLVPTIAVFIGFLIDRIKAAALRWTIVGLFIFVTLFSFFSMDAVTIDDARVGSSQKNVSEVSNWLAKNAKDKDGFVMISAASHDAIIFSSGLPMSKFIHEGTGKYWESATTSPDRWARWIIMRTHDESDQTFKFVGKTPGFSKYELVEKYPFADIYQLKEEYVSELTTKPVFQNQK